MEKRRRERTLEIIGETGVISIIRGIVGESAERAIDALVSGGVRCLEITMNTRGALDLIRAARGRHPDIAVGAGTVLSVADARKAIAAGADFVLAPTLSAPVIRYCNRRDALPVPGVFTPTELLDASLAGALLIKVFPAGSVGPGVHQGPPRPARRHEAASGGRNHVGEHGRFHEGRSLRRRGRFLPGESAPR